MRWLYFLILPVVAILGMVAYSKILGGPPTLDSARVYDSPRPVADFVLQGTGGEDVGPDALKGQWTLLFTGYTYCPDICPTTMAQLSSRMDQMMEATDTPIRVWMISVDPQRDTVEQLTRYVNFFGEEFFGVVGEHPQLYPFVTSLGMMYSVPAPDEVNYDVAHSASIVLVNPNGQQHAIFHPVTRPGQITTIDPNLLVSDFKKIVRNARL